MLFDIERLEKTCNEMNIKIEINSENAGFNFKDNEGNIIKHYSYDDIEEIYNKILKGEIIDGE